MKVSDFASQMILLGAVGMLAMAPAASADDATLLRSETRHMDTLALQGSAKVQGNLVTQFSDFAGSEANAQSLVTGLRGGTPVTLTSVSTSGSTTTTTAFTFDPPTRPMGYGNVFISLALARQQLASYGITDPTAQEIQAALVGGTITTGSGATAQTITLKGILTLRADGMGWGAIAKSQGMNLGQVVSGLKSANHHVAFGSSGGITTAGSAPQTTTFVRGNSANAPGHNRAETSGSGIVTAGGAGVGASASANAGVRAGGAGIVTGSGAANGHGLAKGLNKP